MDIETEIRNINERNARVEQDKTWEVSWTRRLFILVVTYVIAAGWLFVIDNTSPLLNALVPTGGYLLSTLSLPVIRKIWQKK